MSSAKSKSFNEFKPFRVKTIIKRVWSRSYEFKDIGFKSRRTLKFSRSRLHIVSFTNSRLETTSFYINWSFSLEDEYCAYFFSSIMYACQESKWEDIEDIRSSIFHKRCKFFCAKVELGGTLNLVINTFFLLTYHEVVERSERDGLPLPMLSCESWRKPRQKKNW